MKLMPRLLTALLALALCAASATSAHAASAGTSVAKRKVVLKVKSDSQKQILKHGVKVKIKAKKGKHGKAKRAKVKLTSNTFDKRDWVKLAHKKKVKLNKKGKATIKLKLTDKGASRVSSCESRTIRATGKGGKAKVKLVRDTDACKPQPIDLSQADQCDFIGDQGSSRCLLPWPDNYYTVKDQSSQTGRRIALHSDATPANASGTHLDAAAYNSNDGFSPGQTIVVRVPGLDTPAALANTGPVSVTALGKYAKHRAPIVVIDAKTGQRWPIWAEIDSNADTPAETALLIHPAQNFASGHRYIVAMRDLKDSSGNTLEAPEGFRYYRDALPSDQAAINDQRSRFAGDFKKLRNAGIKRNNLYLAWDFTVASDENIAGYALSMRNDAFGKLGDHNLADNVVQGTAPDFTVDSVQNYTIGEDPDMARRVQGTFQVPCYMTNGCAPGGTLNLNANGKPVQNGFWTANFNCMIPRSAVDAPDAAPARASIYGHGLLGSAGEATSSPQKTLGNGHNIMDCATDEIGMAEGDIVNTIGILGNMSKFPQLADRLQQGLIDGLYLGRLLDNNDGFVTDPAFRVDDTGPVDGSNPPVIDTSRLYYNGNSQGAIFGGALTALSPDFTRASLGVGGMNYSVLLNRSVDFDTYAAFLDPAYPDEMSQQLLLSMVQMLWDRGESNGYANRITTNPLPDTPAHELLMDIGVGDHQVTNYSAETMARTVGAQIHAPKVYAGRWPGFKVGWGLPHISSYPYSNGSALVYWDSGPIRDDPSSPDPADVLGTNVPPVENIPNRPGEDPHELPRRTDAEQQMVSDFLQPNAASHITDTCSGAPCYVFNFDGP